MGDALEPIVSLPESMGDALEPIVSLPESMGDALEPIVSLPENANDGLEPVVSAPETPVDASAPIVSLPEYANDGLEPIVSAPETPVDASAPIVSLPESTGDALEPIVSMPESSKDAPEAIVSLPENANDGLEPIVSAPETPVDASAPIVSLPESTGDALEPIVSLPESSKDALDPIISLPENANDALEPIVSAPDVSVGALEPALPLAERAGDALRSGDTVDLPASEHFDVNATVVTSIDAAADVIPPSSVTDAVTGSAASDIQHTPVDHAEGSALNTQDSGQGLSASGITSSVQDDLDALFPGRHQSTSLPSVQPEVAPGPTFMEMVFDSWIVHELNHTKNRVVKFYNAATDGERWDAIRVYIISNAVGVFWLGLMASVHVLMLYAIYLVPTLFFDYFEHLSRVETFAWKVACILALGVGVYFFHSAWIFWGIIFGGLTVTAILFRL
jgi:hypothetical protein